MNLLQTGASLVAGTIFGLGLAVSGLANPDKVLQFLTLNQDWSPALLFTMGAGVLVTFVGYRLVTRRSPLLASEFHMPLKTALDRPLLIGAAIFGLGWGLAGFCPGPALVGLMSGMAEPFVFVGAMLAGAQLHRVTS